MSEILLLTNKILSLEEDLAKTKEENTHLRTKATVAEMTLHNVLIRPVGFTEEQVEKMTLSLAKYLGDLLSRGRKETLN